MKHVLSIVSFAVLAILLAGCNKPSSIVGPPSSGSISWTQVTGLTGFYNMASSGGNLYAAGNYGVFRSTDGGSTWTLTDSSLSGGSFTIAAVDSGLLIGDYANQTGVRRSTDGGYTWTALDSGLGTSFPGVYQTISSIVSNTKVIFAGTSSNGIYRSTDNGASWSAANSGISYGATVYCFAVSGTRVIAGTQSGTYMSANNGETWVVNDSGMINTNPYYGGSPYVTSLVSSGAFVYAGALGSQVYMSVDSGTTWYDISGSLPGSSQSGVGLAVVDTNLIVADDNGVFLSTNSGNSWKNLSGNLPNSGLYSFDEVGGYLFVQMGDGSVWRLAVTSI